MNTTVHPVAPEEVMAVLDGELSATDAQVISTHVDRCTECTNLAERLRSTSQSLSRWNVQAAPAELEDAVTNAAAKAASGLKIEKANLFVRASFWTWKQWTAGLGVAAGVLLLLIGIATPNLMRTSMAPQTETVAVGLGRLQKSEREGF